MVWIALPISLVIIGFFIFTLYRGYKFEREAEMEQEESELKK